MTPRRASRGKFIGRQRELSDLANVLRDEGAGFILVYGRRRVGKTTLLLHWAKQSAKPYIYWVATRDTPAQVRQSFARALWSFAHPGSQAVPHFETWSDLFDAALQLIGDREVILILDEFSYAVESDPSLPSNLQAAWDHLFKESLVTLVLAGSHLGMMQGLLSYQSPLYGRFTAQLPVGSLPFSALREFLPRYDVTERMAVYSLVGGIPAYLERFSDKENIGANLKRLFMRRTGMFRSEPFMLVGDVIRRESQTYESVLKAIAEGQHTPGEVGTLLGLSSAYLSPYLKQLEALHLVERRIPVTVPPDKRRASRDSRYFLADAYLRFYYRFLAPNLTLVEQEQEDLLWERISEQLRAFVGGTFEEVCRDWVLMRARKGALPMVPEIVGSHWSKTVQVDVMAVNWRDRTLLLGECKWGQEAVGKAVVSELMDKGTRLLQDVLPDQEWRLHHVVFARVGFTEAAQKEAKSQGVMLVDVNQIDEDLAST